MGIMYKRKAEKTINYVTLDDRALREQAQNDPKLFLEEHPWPLLIDEAQYAPELFPYLAGWESARDLQLSSVSGHYLETYIVSEIVKSYNAIGKTPNISYYRDKDKNEIDLVFYKNNKLYPFEIKKTAMPNISMIKNFKMLENSGKEIEAGGVICLYDKFMRLDEKNYIIPVSCVINC